MSIPAVLTVTKDGDNHVIHGEVDWNGIEGKILSLNYYYGKKTKNTTIKQLVGGSDYFPGGTVLPSEISHTWNPSDGNNEKDITYQLSVADQTNDWGFDQETVKL